MGEITSIPTLESLQTPGATPKPVAGPDASSFGQVLMQSINDVSRLQNEADQVIKELASGRQLDIHNTMISMEKASVAFKLLMQIRNKVISAYETIMRMQV
jgi:flagellar hook-basal body complex protein FliE